MSLFNISPWCAIRAMEGSSAESLEACKVEPPAVPTVVMTLRCSCVAAQNYIKYPSAYNCLLKQN